MSRLRAGAALGALVMVIAACGSTDGVDVDNAWARTSPMMTSAGAVYMDLTAADGDSLLSASVDPSIASSVEVHETVSADGMTDDTMDGEMEGAMTMQPVDSIELPAGDTVSLEPGGLHIMLLDLVSPLETGQTIELTLHFADAGEQVVGVEVMEDAPS